MSELPAAWPLDAAVVRVAPEFLSWDRFCEDHAPGSVSWNAVIEIARLIEKHERRPVDPMLELARSIAAIVFVGLGNSGVAAAYRDGHQDGNAVIQDIADRLRSTVVIRGDVS